MSTLLLTVISINCTFSSLFACLLYKWNAHVSLMAGLRLSLHLYVHHIRAHRKYFLLNLNFDVLMLRDKGEYRKKDKSINEFDTTHGVNTRFTARLLKCRVLFVLLKNS